MPKSHPFTRLPSPKPDPIFAITAEAIAAGPQAINGTIGVVMDEEGNVLMFPSVAAALKDLGSSLQKQNMGYPALAGMQSFRTAVTKLILGNRDDCITAFATTGGTGAVTINLRLIKLLYPDAPVILPLPAWANHPPVCRAAGIPIVEVPYLSSDQRPQIDRLLAAIQDAKGPFSILLQVGCHNPTGLDFTDDQWKHIIDALKEKECIALLDFAYQGFKGEPAADAAPIHWFADAKIPLLVAWSASKNHSIYGLRCGLACAFAPNAAMQQTLEGHYSTLTRGIHSAASTFGQLVVARVQEAYQKEWLADLRSARDTVGGKRQAMLKHLPPAFRNAVSGHGMFAMLPLTPEQVDELKLKHRVFLTRDGRINIAGIPYKRIEELCKKITAVAG
jgi:aspartate/tyrosine/aromatic aminotransferase